MSVDLRRFASVFVPVAAVAVWTAAMAGAEPVPPVPPGPPIPPAPAEAVALPAEGAAPAVPSEGVPHLASPDALPPGSTMDRSVMGNESPNVGYLKDLWHAVKNQEISGKEALILGIAQRGMNTPYPQQAPGPNVPVAPVTPDTPVTPADPAPVLPPTP